MWNNNYGYKKKQKQINLVAHDRILVFENFRYLMEGLEEYVEKTGYFPNFKRQFRNITVPKEKRYSLDNCEGLFRTRLLLFVGIISDDTPDDTRKEVQDEFYKWINLVGIDVNNCPDEKLKHFLVETNNVIEGNGEKIVEQSKKYLNSKQKTNPTSLENMGDVIEVFSSIQVPLEKKREEADFYKDKNYFGVEVKDKFNKGNSEQGKQVFDRVAGSVASRHNEFDFFSEQKNRRGIQSVSSQQSINHPTNPSEVVREVKTNPQNWTLNEIATEIDRFGWEKKKEPVIYCRHARLDDYGQEGKLNFNNNPIYRWESFNSQQRFEIKKVKNIFGDYLTDKEIKWVVKEVKDNPSIWRIEIVEGRDCLVHSSAEGKNNEIGTLIHNRQKFSESEWMEIDKVLKIDDENRQIIESIKGDINSWKVEPIQGNEWLVHKQAQNPYVESEIGQFLHSKQRFTDEEWKEINEVLNNRQSWISQAVSSVLPTNYRNKQNYSLGAVVSVSQPQKDGNNMRTGKVLGILGIISVAVIASVVVVKKRLNRKVKK